MDKVLLYYDYEAALASYEERLMKINQAWQRNSKMKNIAKPVLLLSVLMTIDDGIIKGAKWIKANYYNKGCKTLQAMISIGNYASDSRWSNGILSIMKESYRII